MILKNIHWKFIYTKYFPYAIRSYAKKIPNGFRPFRVTDNDTFCRTTKFNRSNRLIVVSEELYEARTNNEPIVALESTIITHGMPYPHNLQTAKNVESIIRNNGAIPATIGVIDGIIFIGLQSEQLEWLAKRGYEGPKLQTDRLSKISQGDLAAICQMKGSGGTTVSSTAYLANMVGIRVFVTGGIGGVHRGAEISMDISTDLMELSRTPICVVSAGIKSILDVEKSLEVLETNGVCVAVFDGDQTDDTNRVEFPAFYTPNSGHFVNYNFLTAKSIAELIDTRDEIGLKMAILLAVPNRTAKANEYQRQFDDALKQALEQARQEKIKGKMVTPFLLSKMSQLTNEQTLQLNQNLIENNANVGAAIAIEYSKLMACRQQTLSFSSSNVNDQSKDNKNDYYHISRFDSKKPPIVIGGSVYDIITKINSSNIQLNGSTYDGSVAATLGGVGRNIAESIQRLQQPCLLITAVGHDQPGQMIISSVASAINNQDMTNGIRLLEQLPTSSCTVIIDNDGECRLIVGDFRANQCIDKNFVFRFETELKQAPIVITDANLPTETMNYVCQQCRLSKIPVWFEPTDLNLIDKLFQINGENFDAIKFLSPNFNELQAIYEILTSGHRKDSSISRDKLSSAELIEVVNEYGSELFRHLSGLHSIIVTVDKHGIIYVGPDDALDSKMVLGPCSNLFNNNEKVPIKSVHMMQENVANVVNVSGAGDCLVGATVYGWLNQMTYRDSLRFGLKAARLSVGTFETVPKNLHTIISKTY
ncbi:uncharacterized protein LOC113791544 isoform X2 [Dermatophagoides pteronyssinus]|uniref:uncharacterized protein LOC113791544 isoform X2 n=1 Tax=Dermatophagoides pteronyssinus TaxID=6956 RepID=UPI003F67CCD8